MRLGWTDEQSAPLSRLNRLDLLVIDDFGLAPLGDQERQDLLEILEDRYDMRSTIVASQLPTESWHDQLGDPTVADAILDRVLHNAHRVVLQGPSRRKEVNPIDHRRRFAPMDWRSDHDDRNG